MANELINPDKFQEMFSRILSDPAFRRELQSGGVATLKNYGLTVDMPASVESQLNSIQRTAAVPQCGTCGVCGLCSLCGEINAGSGSAFLWATFFLGDAAIVAQPST